MNRVVLIILAFMIYGCKTQPKKIKYSFFVAGHTYGDPREKGATKGIYQPFVEKFEFINEQKNMKAGFFLGDVVWRPDVWEEALEDIETLNMPVHIVRGNHDGPLKEFEKKFGKSYSSYIEEDNLFIILDANLDKWNISGDQLVFLMNTLRNDSEGVNNIFVLLHQVIWWSEDKFRRPRPNSTQNRAENPNYWSKLEPLFQNAEKPVYLFAGDVGAFSSATLKTTLTVEYFYHKENNITYISSGMGGGVKDNFVIVDILNDHSVAFRLVHLNGEDMNSLGRLEDYKIPN